MGRGVFIVHSKAVLPEARAGTVSFEKSTNNSICFEIHIFYYTVSFSLSFLTIFPGSLGGRFGRPGTGLDATRTRMLLSKKKDQDQNIFLLQLSL